MDYGEYQSPLGKIVYYTEGNKLVKLFFSDQLMKGCGVKKNNKQIDQWLDHYFQGRQPSFADIALNINLTAFQKRVFKQVMAIKPGETKSYGEIAKQLGMKTGGARAIGRCLANNPVLLIIPCHRVVGSDGSLVGYAGGIDQKKKLLIFEQRGNND